MAVLRAGWVLIGPMSANEEPVPVPHLRVVSGRDEVRVLHEPIGGTNGLWSQEGEVGGKAGQERGIRGLAGHEGGCEREQYEGVEDSGTAANCGFTENGHAGHDNAETRGCWVHTAGVLSKSLSSQAGIPILPFGCEPIYRRLIPLAIPFASIPTPDTRSCRAGPPPRPRSRVPHLGKGGTAQASTLLRW